MKYIIMLIFIGIPTIAWMLLIILPLTGNIRESWVREELKLGD